MMLVTHASHPGKPAPCIVSGGQAGGWHVECVYQHPHGVAAGQGWQACCQLNECDATAPDVSSSAVSAQS